MHLEINRPGTTHRVARHSRRAFGCSLASLALARRTFATAPGAPQIPLTAINHMKIQVSDPARSLEWYQGLFGMPIVARQADTVVLQVGHGPQFLAIAGGVGSKPRIEHFCLSTDHFKADRIAEILSAHGLTRSQASGPMKLSVALRGRDSGGATEGTPELHFGDPDGLMVQLQDTTYDGGAGRLGEFGNQAEPAPTKGLLSVRNYNHFTIVVSDQLRTIAFYQRLFGLRVDTHQGPLPILRVGAGNQFLAFIEAGGGRTGPRIHHACLTVEGFAPDEILGLLEGYGVTPSRDARQRAAPLKSYVTMRMPNRGGAPGGTPELYFTDPDGILLQIQDVRYCGGSGYLENSAAQPKADRGSEK